MNLTKKLLPLPIFLKEFEDITRVQEDFKLNRELIEIMKPEYIVASVGLHNPKKPNASSSIGST